MIGLESRTGNDFPEYVLLHALLTRDFFFLENLSATFFPITQNLQKKKHCKWTVFAQHKTFLTCTDHLAQGTAGLPSDIPALMRKVWGDSPWLSSYILRLGNMISGKFWTIQSDLFTLYRHIVSRYCVTGVRRFERAQWFLLQWFSGE
jgi:hypothetical protein